MLVKLICTEAVCTWVHVRTVRLDPDSTVYGSSTVFHPVAHGRHPIVTLASTALTPVEPAEDARTKVRRTAAAVAGHGVVCDEIGAQRPACSSRKRCQ